MLLYILPETQDSDGENAWLIPLIVVIIVIAVAGAVGAVFTWKYLHKNR